MNNERLLIVEDEKIIAIDLQRRLERFGYIVVGMAGDGEEAVRLALELNPDLILMDIMLNGPIDGIQTATLIKEQRNIPFIFLTAYTDEKTLERAKSVQPYGYILKPFKERELYTTIDIALYKHQIEGQLSKQERLFSAILHSVNDGIIATDIDLNIQFMNPIAEDIVGISEDSVRGKHISQFLVLNDPKTQQDLLTATQRIAEKPLYIQDVNVRSSSGQSLIIDGSITRINEEANSTDGFVITMRDITELKRMSETINYQSSHDNLTGLSNREEFSYKLTEIIRNVKMTNAAHSLMMMDVDRFKAVNDTCGAMAGDELLRQVASHIQTIIQRSDISARIGGDEFAIILMNCDSADSVNVANRLQEAVQRQRFIWQTVNFPLSLSIGIVPIDKDTGDIHSVLAAADDACHISKEEGGTKCTIFQAQETKFRQRRGDMEWIGKINRAVEENRFVLYYQPIVPLNNSHQPKLEILVRLINEDGSIAKPNDFIPAAERYNLMPQIDRWVVENSIRAFRILQDQHSELAESIFSINLSGPSLLDESLIESILYFMTKYNLPAKNFCFEITETAAIQNLSYATRFINRLKSEGFTFALDDFGAGFSSFGYLRSLPVDYVKIDGSFVQNIDESKISYTMVESINSIGHVMGLQTIAEFVKNEAIRDKCTALGVDYGQGYFFAEPKPIFG
ncbi:MAG: two-component system response regulator [Spirochaetes bacterium GWD1_61_31]|nr:MAG: two-component system response regulator [Spirochaetes bacterium GWB1_60_80]OHD29948.1 MAG: two-component system response regulator [Spirochaetes bacterium GWC1_61_12]OHD43806.1 MAG: two-component system response regulator [Spirochaetes bacterium GWD1_61_31]OHD46048.1 MAG: two-component system response regulator [Spirochaetes bacterium GWE1_60_18]OHD60620.1 MAG: two-component system response regulator [Spirochaetes bacterium GWF1_60_12]HAP43459.1 two-component system response regulator 